MLYGEQNKEKEQEHFQTGNMAVRILDRHCFSAEDRKNSLRAVNNALFHMARAKIRHNNLIDDLAGGRIGKHRFQPVSNLDADLVFMRGDYQQNAVVLTLLPDMPVSAQLIAVVIDAVAVQRGNGRYDYLIGCAILIGCELLVERLDCGRRKYMRVVYNPASQRRERLRRHRWHCI